MNVDRRQWVVRGLAGAALFCALWGYAASLRWPLIGDASLIHYVVLLIGRGMAPYRAVRDINLPGSYLFEWLAMRGLGDGALGWRLWDGLLLVLIGGSMTVIARGRLAAAVLAASVFALVHLSDGIFQAGQRDLLLAALLAGAYALLFGAQRGLLPRWTALAAMLLIGVSLTVKPVFVPLAFVLLGLGAGPLRGRDLRPGVWISGGLAAVLLPWAVAALWLAHWNALQAFLAMSTGLLPLHASMGRRPLLYLLSHSVSPAGAVLGLWLLTRAALRWRWDAERTELWAGLILSVLAYVSQGKGYPYQRYPVLLFLLLLAAMSFADALGEQGWRRWPALAGLAFLALGVALPAMRTTLAIAPATPMQTALEHRLRTMGPTLSGSVQCVDTFGGCLNVLYDLRLEQATGFLYDCYAEEPGATPAGERYAREYVAAIAAARPRVIVVTDQFCFGDTRGFDKVNRAPALASLLATRYALAEEWHSPRRQRWWAREEQPVAFQLFLLRP